jgi:outer membrane protein OmpA-like peptidoglycan-associated protein
VAPLLVANPAAGARIIGLASRSGSIRHNQDLSVRRARNVEISLSLFLFANNLVNPPSPPPRTSVGGQGETFAANLNVKDGTEDSRFRSVLVTVLADRTNNSPVRLLPP